MLHVTDLPASPCEPLIESVHGVPVSDPFRWLEEQNSTRTREWLREQDRYTRSYLSQIPGRDRVRTRVAELLSPGAVQSLRKAGPRYFFLKREAQQEQPSICMREGPNGDDETLIDPMLYTGTAYATVRIHQISDDGALLAFEVRQGGEDTCAIEFFDVRKRQHLADRLPGGRARGLVFAPGNESFFYVHEVSGVPHSACRGVLQHTFGTPMTNDRDIFSCRDEGNVRLALGGDNGCLCIEVRHRNEKTTSDYFLWDLRKWGAPKLIVKDVQPYFAVGIYDGNVFALTDHNAPKYKIIRLAESGDGQVRWREVIPESKLPIGSFVFRNGILLVVYQQWTVSLVVMYDSNGNKIDEFAPPQDGTVRVNLAASDKEEIFYTYESFRQPPLTIRYLVRSSEQIIWEKRQIPLDTSDLTSVRVVYPSRDGTQVPMHIVGKKEVLSYGPRPTILTGYGGFGVSVTPQFGAFTSFMMEKGCVFALANLRGGGEFGPEWHEAARRRKRQNSFDDFIAAALWLVKHQYTSPEQLTIFGGSNSALLVGVAITQRPDLFRAAFCLGPLFDMVRYHLFTTNYHWTEEYGSPENPEDFAALRAYSPYHQVKDGVAYPALLIISGDTDKRCDAMHARKMTARIQRATSSVYPVLLDYSSHRGHMPSLPLCDRIEGLTNRIAFVCNQLGIAV